MIANFSLGAPHWTIPAALAAGVLFLAILWSYSGGTGPRSIRLLAALLKVVAIAALALCLVEPLFSALRPRPGANLFVVAADNSQSLRLKDERDRQTRAERLKSVLDDKQSWHTRLSQDFDVRRYTFDTRVQPVADFSRMSFDGQASFLGTTLSTVLGRFHERPVAGVLLLTDGNATDLEGPPDMPPDGPPIYPVLVGSDGQSRDIRLARVAVSQTNFESSPVTIVVEASATGYEGSTIVFQLLDDSGLELQRFSLRNKKDGEPIAHRFMVRPEDPGVTFFRARVFARQDEGQLEHADRVSEATLENNSRLVMVDQGGGPYRVLYVSGRPNWEFKFLRRAIHEDEQVNLVGLIRIAKKEPKFTFRGHIGENTNPIYRGFGDQDAEDQEQYDQPVLLRLGVREDGEELTDGFPKSAEELFAYHALILDDLEASFFTADQMSLIQEFVSSRGGGLLMLGGRESFASGKYNRTPIGELMPVYLDRPAERPSTNDFQLQLTREGWLQPWTRLRSNEPDEKRRIEEMPRFMSLNPHDTIKPGATVLARVQTPAGKSFPALVVQRFGKGRTAALLVGDLWRWNLRRPNPADSDLEKSWRQTVRWLVADVPSRVEAEVRHSKTDAGAGIEILARVLDQEYQPFDNATVTIQVETPEGAQVKLSTTSSDSTAGGYTARFTSRVPGAYLARVEAMAADGSEIGQREIGWATEPASLEFERLAPNRELLAALADQSGGEVLELDQLEEFVTTLPNRKIPITEPWTYPLWHHWGVLAFSICCLAGEWGLRRWKGLP